MQLSGKVEFAEQNTGATTLAHEGGYVEAPVSMTLWL